MRRNRLIELRKKKELTQKDVVNILKESYGITITTSYYGMIERGVRLPSLLLGITICTIFNCTADNIFFEDKPNINLQTK